MVEFCQFYFVNLETTLILFGGLNENGYLSADLAMIELGNCYLISFN